MYINNNHPARILSNYIRQQPNQFDTCISELVRLFINDLDLDIPDEDIAKFSTIYKFIFMYSMITSNFSTVINIMRSSVAITTVVNALITNGNLKLRQHLELVNSMLAFGKKYSDVLNSHNAIVRCCLNFNANVFYKIIKQVANKYTNNGF